MKKGYFGDFGGCFVPELLMPPLMELEQAMEAILPSEAFQSELRSLLKDFAGRETPLTFCPALSQWRCPHYGIPLGHAHTTGI